MPRLGSALIVYQMVTSTNDVARDLALRGAPEGTTIISMQQSAGRGRLGRTWISPAGDGLYLSAILRPRVSPGKSPVLTLAAAVSVAETLALDYGVTADIKWPNDVLGSGKKISGILIEAAIEGADLQYVIVGIGVNLRQQEFPEHIRDTATSLRVETGISVSPQEFAGRLLPRLESAYQIAIACSREIIERWEARSTYAHGRAVRITSSDEYVDGITRGLSESGGLLLELDSGELREIASGEVSLRPAAS